jgi:nitrogen fixation NifU-like protein
MSDSPAVMARVRDARGAGWLPRDAADVGTGEANSADGDLTRIQVRAAADGIIRDAVFKVSGSNAAFASASLVTERLHGASVQAAADLEAFVVVAELQLPMERAAAAARAVEAARRAVEDWKQKQAAPRR